MSVIEAPKLLRVREVAEMLSCPEQQVWAMIYRRDFESVKLAPGRGRRVELSVLLKYLERCRVPARPDVAISDG